MGDRDLIISQIRQRLEILYQMVEELENQPGPGPGPGTSDYDDLSNKPSINDVELSGNKTAAQLGLATSSSVSSITSRFEDLITPDNIEVEDDGQLPSTIDSRLALHQPIMLNHAIYYCYDESGVDYTYVALDTSGAYPKLSYAQIFKDNKRVHFYDYSTDTVPASNSNNFITSGGVYTALSAKADTSSLGTAAAANTTTSITSGGTGLPTSGTVYTALEAKTSLAAVFGRGTAIQSNTDLNDITQIGRYYSLDSSVSNTLINAPITTSGFVMSVENNYQSSGGNTGVIQTATITGSSSVIIYKRAYRASGGVWGWTPWIKFEGTAGT